MSTSRITARQRAAIRVFLAELSYEASCAGAELSHPVRLQFIGNCVMVSARTRARNSQGTMLEIVSGTDGFAVIGPRGGRKKTRIKSFNTPAVTHAAPWKARAYWNRNDR